jgi:hypothetical protein
MDIRCTKCGEPWDVEILHDLVAEKHDRDEWVTNGRYDQAKYDPFYAEARQAFRSKGCEALGARHAVRADHRRALLSDALHELLGDDVDGIAALTEDFDLLID